MYIVYTINIYCRLYNLRSLLNLNFVEIDIMREELLLRIPVLGKLVNFEHYLNDNLV